MYPSPKISVAPSKRHGAAPRRALYNNAVSLAKQESRGPAATGAEVLRRIAAIWTESRLTLSPAVL
jgi:hypothetical protein